MFNYHGTHDTRIIGMAKFGDCIWNQIKLAMSVNESKGSARRSHQRELFRQTFRKVFHDVCQEFQLIDEMRVFGIVDFRELEFEERKLLVNPLENLRSNGCRPMMHELYDLS